MTPSTNAKTSQARGDLERAVAALRDSATWKRNLAVLARFHRYSWHNQVLICCQRPDASFVRGFTGWLAAGRAVRKGERGIRIFAPRPWQRTATDEEGEETVEAGLSFAVVHVFDVAQTDPIPDHPHPWDPPTRHAAAGDEAVAWDIWHALLEHAATLGLLVSTAAGASGDTYGFYHPARRAIWVRPGRARADMTATLAHELAHAITHEATADLSRDVREVVAESIAYAVCSRFGLDLELRSAHYVATWLDDPAAFRVGMTAIHDGAAALIDVIESACPEPEPLPLAA
jgi:antirestriction protein ArdC